MKNTDTPSVANAHEKGQMQGFVTVATGSVLYRSAVSGMWYRNPRAAGDVDTVKVGPTARHLDLPNGAEIVVGPMRKGDLVADIYAPSWDPIDAEDDELDAATYDCVCRPTPNIADVGRAGHALPPKP